MPLRDRNFLKMRAIIFIFGNSSNFYFMYLQHWRPRCSWVGCPLNFFLGSSRVISILRIFDSSSCMSLSGFANSLILGSLMCSSSQSFTRLIYILITGTDAVSIRVLEITATTLSRAEWSMDISSMSSDLVI